MFTKIYIKRVSVCDEPNKNNVIYTKDQFNIGIDKAFNNLGNLPVIIKKHNNDIKEDCTINIEDVVGFIIDMNDIEDTRVGVYPINDKYLKIISELVSKKYKLGLKYISNVVTDVYGMKYVSDMKIMGYELLSPNDYECLE